MFSYYDCAIGLGVVAHSTSICKKQWSYDCSPSEILQCRSDFATISQGKYDAQKKSYLLPSGALFVVNGLVSNVLLYL